MSTATSSRAVAVEGLRRLLFSPSRILAVGALACALALGGRALGQDAVDYADGTEIVETLTVNANSLAITANGKVAYNDILVDGRELTELPVLSFAGDDHVVKGVARILRGGLNTTQSKSVTFDNAFDVADGSEIVLGGAAAFNGVVDVAASKIDASGNVVFKSAFNLNAKSEATLSENVNLDGVVNVNGSKLAAFGNVAFNNALNVNDKTGVATLSGNVKANQAVTVNGGATLNAQGDAKFAKAVVASGKSTLNASGNAQFNGGAVAYGSTIDAKGNAAFNDEVNLKAGSQLNLTGAVDGETVRMNKVVNVDNESKLYSHGNVQYNDDVNLTNGSEARFYQNGDEAITTSFADGVTLTIDASQAFADASHLQVDVDMKGGQLTYGNYGGDVLPDDNKVYVTYDENNDATEITYNNGKAKIDKAFDKGDVVKNKITGNGTLAFGGFDSFSDSLTLKNGYTVVLDSSESSSKEDHFAFSGATDVKKGFVVIEGDTSFGAIDAADDANVVTVTGEFYDKYDNAAVYGNANLYDENGNPIFVKEEAGAQVYFTYDKKGVEVALAVDADGKLAAFDKNGNSLEIKAQDVAVGDLYKVESAGMLGFYRNGVDAALAPTLNANKVNFVGGQAYGEKIGLYGDGDVARGARLWLDAKGTESTYKLGEINANEINFGSDTSIWYDETSTHHENAQKLTFELNAPTVTVGNVQNNADALTNVFDKPLINVEVVGKHLDEQLVGYTVTASAKNLETFARERGKDANLAAQIDSKRYGAQGEDHEFFESLWNEDDPEVVEQVLHNLGLLGYYNPLYTSRFGTADSSFYFGSMSGSVLSGEHKRGQEDRPDAPTPPPSVLEEEEKEPEKTREIWAAYSRVDVDGEEYMYEGRAVAGYDLQRAGIIGGINRQFDATLSGGLFFALTAPEIESLAKVAALSKSFVNTRMEMTDFQFAGHIEKVFADNWELALYVGGGHQSMEWERRVQLGNFAETYRADSTGNTLIGTAYFAYRYDVTDNWTLRPTLGFDSEHAWLYNFTESGCNAERKDVDYAAWFLGQRLHYANSYYNRNTARVGLSTSINGTQGFAGLSGRVFYATQLGGDAAPQLTVTSDALGDINVDSHAMGGESVTVGGGGYLHLNQAKTFTAESDVNATWYKNASTLNVTGGVSYRY